ncbi:MAG: M23 family metallopeptidase [bacterium]|nr:M23 family metallopeptidase [bacterium]
MKILRKLKKLAGNSYFTISLISPKTGIRSFIITQKAITASAVFLLILIFSMTANTLMNYRENNITRDHYDQMQAKLGEEQRKVERIAAYFENVSNSAEVSIINLSDQLPYTSTDKNTGGLSINVNNPFKDDRFSDSAFHNNMENSFDLLFELSELISYLNNSYSTLQIKLDQLESVPDGLPMRGSIVSGFGMRKSPFGKHQHFHRGIDVINVVNASVRAGGDGVVLATGKNSLWGNNVLIDHGFNIKTQYGHLNKILVKKGQKVKKGDIIGKMGNTGRTTGPHLHYQVWVGENPQDPFLFIAKKELKKLHFMDTGSISNANLGGDGKR